MPTLPYSKLTADPALMASGTARDCFHCGQPLPARGQFSVVIDAAPRTMCCPGCAAVAQAICDMGLGEYYRLRTARPASAPIVPELLREARVYDHPAVQQSFVRQLGNAEREAALILEGIVCAACVWLNERQLSRLPGVLAVDINYATHRARVRWDESRIQLSRILAAVHAIGYRAHPYDPARAQEILERERKSLLRRLGVAGVLGMQVMTLAVALYAGAASGIETEYKTFFQWLSLALTLPVLLYSAQPFFAAAWRDLRARHTGMDLPVALGLSLAFGGSVWATLHGTGEVYYDSVVMFVFFLLGGRYLELMARRRASHAAEGLANRLPVLATRLIGSERAPREETVAASTLAAGDRVLIRPGEPVPADGTVIEGRSSVDEALMTGESRPLPKTVGADVIAGSLNVESPLRVRVTRAGQDTQLAAMLRLLERALNEKPALARAADRAAHVFIAVVLPATALVATYWWLTAPEQWLPIAVAMLVITCPCALSLATPTALTAATGRLAKHGVLVTRANALENLARATHVIFDKTGTLTEGRPRLTHVETFGAPDDTHCLRLAAALEAASEHPLAHALRRAADDEALHVSGVTNTPGLGVRGDIAGTTYYLGSAAFIAEHSGQALSADKLERLGRDGQGVVLLADARATLAAFSFDDPLRGDAAALVSELKRLGKRVLLLSGDHSAAVRRVADACGIDVRYGELKPADKLARVRQLQNTGAVVAMVGDGVNDAAALAAAHVSIAMGRGAAVTAAAADMILLSDRLSDVQTAVHTAAKTLRVIRQNIARAAIYNAVALPAAALGYVAPWLAAIGMSASSLLVVANALRLVERRPAAPA